MVDSILGFLFCHRTHIFVHFRSLEQIKVELLQQLQNLQGAPSVQMQQVPPLFEIAKPDEEDPDERPKAKTKHGDGDKRPHEAELYDKVD